MNHTTGLRSLITKFKRNVYMSIDKEISYQTTKIYILRITKQYTYIYSIAFISRECYNFVYFAFFV